MDPFLAIQNFMAIAVELINLSKKFGSHEAVRRLYLHVPSGCFYTLLGTNGAGKTTSLLLMCGLITPDEGDVLIDVRALPVSRKPPSR